MDGVAKGADVRLLLGIGYDDHLLDGGEILEDLRDPGEGIEAFALEEVSIGDEKDLRLDLSETVQDPLDAEIGGTGGPHRPQAGGGEHGDDGLGHVRHEAGDAVARSDPATPSGLLAILATSAVSSA